MLLQVYPVQYSKWMSRKEGGIDPDPAEGRRHQVRKTSSKDVLTLSLWSKSRGPRRQTKRPQSPRLSSLPRSFLGHHRNLHPFYLSLRWFLHITSLLHHNMNSFSVEFCLLLKTTGATLFHAKLRPSQVNLLWFYKCLILSLRGCGMLIFKLTKGSGVM